MKHVHIVDKVLPGSIAEELEIEKGDRLISINGQEIGDVFDYHFLVNDDFLTVLIEKSTGEQWELEIEKDYEDDLGIEFGQGLMDEYRSCRNKCMFCFIDQMPKGMRETLYFKDDDSRLSFLQGNYITLTNMSDDDVDRIIRYHLEPINISFHTTNPELRCKMLHNRFAGEALKKIDRLYEGGITMNGQIVLCKGVNDGEELERSIRVFRACRLYRLGLRNTEKDCIRWNHSRRKMRKKCCPLSINGRKRHMMNLVIISFMPEMNGIFSLKKRCRKRNAMMVICNWRTVLA